MFKIKLMEFKEKWKDVSLMLILKDKGGKQHCLPICWFSPGGWDIFQKRKNIKKRLRIETEDWGFSVNFVFGFQENSIYTSYLCFS